MVGKPAGVAFSNLVDIPFGGGFEFGAAQSPIAVGGEGLRAFIPEVDFHDIRRQEAVCAAQNILDGVFQTDAAGNGLTDLGNRLEGEFVRRSDLLGGLVLPDLPHHDHHTGSGGQRDAMGGGLYSLPTQGEPRLAFRGAEFKEEIRGPGSGSDLMQVGFAAVESQPLTGEFVGEIDLSAGLRDDDRVFAGLEVERDDGRRRGFNRRR